MNYVAIGRTTPDLGHTRRDLISAAGYRCECLITHKGRVLGRCHQRVTYDTAELDHCLIRRNKKFRKWINAQVWNWQVSCHACNNTHLTDREPNRRAHFEKVVSLFGLERIQEDMLTAPEKMQLHNSDWLEVWNWLSLAARQE